MNKPIRTKHPLFSIVNNAFVDLPLLFTTNVLFTINISSWWKLGSLHGLCLIIQSLTDIFWAIHYTADIILAFNSVNHICRDVNNGWLLRTLYANWASFFLFVFIFLLNEEFIMGLIYSLLHD